MLVDILLVIHYFQLSEIVPYTKISSVRERSFLVHHPILNAFCKPYSSTIS